MRHPAWSPETLARALRATGVSASRQTVWRACVARKLPARRHRVLGYRISDEVVRALYPLAWRVRHGDAIALAA